MNDPDGGRWAFLSVICIAVVLSLTTWFSATAVVSDLTERWQLGTSAAAWLTNAVQVGFVAGALISSFLGLPDIFRLNRLIATAALAAALANLVLIAEPGVLAAILARFATGFALANVYPPAIKMMVTWFRTARGLALGLLIGALTLGSALPYLVRAGGIGADWRIVIAVSSVLCLLSAGIFAFFLREGPHAFESARFDPRQIGAILRDRPVMLANLGYFGHMWELYAMWGWLLAYFGAALVAGGAVPWDNAALFAFAVIAAGVPGCVIGGFVSDRIGRSLTTVAMMAASGTCALLIGFAFAGPMWLFALIAFVWGGTVVADSAQFSAAVTELADRRLVGSALALQMGLGFGVTIVSIWLVPVVAGLAGGWQWAFLALVPGPAVGVWAMLMLRMRPESIRMAGGLR